MPKTSILICLLLIAVLIAPTSVGQENAQESDSATARGSAQVQDQEKPPTKVDPEKEKELVRKLAGQATEDFSNGEYESALTAAKQLCELRPDVIRYQFLRGNIGFAAGKMDQSISAFDHVIRLDADLEPQLWQRGLALYYANRFEDGVKQFETHQTVNSQDVENAVWHLLCAARVSDLEKARKKLIPITDDTRVPMSQVYEMFAGRMTPKEVLIAAQTTTPRVKKDSGSHRLQLYYAHLYTGLYYEMLGKSDSASASLKLAADVNPLGKQNFMGQVARVHLQLLDSKKKPEATGSN